MAKRKTPAATEQPKIGLIQTRGIGDVVIAAPIAQYFIDRGHEVLWPVDSRFEPFLATAFPEIRFLRVDPAETGLASFDYFFQRPWNLLTEAGCQSIYSLYSALSGVPINNPKLAASLKFDEYKYAACGVPFGQKWKLRVQRDAAREQALFEKLGISGPYVVVHEQGSDFRINIELPADVVAGHQVVKITDITDNPFDWIGIIEKAEMFVCVDSMFANLAEQLNLCKRKFLFLRSDVKFTPVFINDWQFR